MSISLSIRQTISMSIRSIVAAGISNPLPLDNISGIVAAYSLRKLITAYAGSAIRVRRSSDNAEADIGFAGNALDSAALLAHCGAGDGYIVTWYDQSGNARNATQSTTTAQPTIVVSGVQNTDGITFDGTADSLAVTSWGAVAQPFARNFVVALPTSGNHVINSRLGSPNTADTLGSNQLVMYAGTGVNANTYTTNARTVLISVYDGAASFQTKNGVSTGAINPGTGGFAGVRLCSYDGTFAYTAAKFLELIIVAGALSTEDREAIENDQIAEYIA